MLTINVSPRFLHNAGSQEKLNLIICQQSKTIVMWLMCFIKHCTFLLQNLFVWIFQSLVSQWMNSSTTGRIPFLRRLRLKPSMLVPHKRWLPPSKCTTAYTHISLPRKSSSPCRYISQSQHFLYWNSLVRLEKFLNYVREGWEEEGE